MKRSLALALALAAGAVALAVAPAPAGAKAAPTPVTVVMHDPGCHWFSVDGALRRTLTVEGPAVLTNLDIATLDIVGGRYGMHADRIGKQVTLSPGSYTIVMVGQARDDNVLKLTVK